jgi:hypothetical protein
VAQLNRNAYKLEQNNKIQQQILKVVLLASLDEEELNSEHEVKQAGQLSSLSRTWYKDENSPKQQIQYRAECYNLLKPIKLESLTKPLGNLYSCPSCADWH